MDFCNETRQVNNVRLSFFVQKKNIFFTEAKRGEAGSVHQTKPTTTSDSLRNLQPVMLKTAFFNVNPNGPCVLDISKLQQGC